MKYLGRLALCLVLVGLLGAAVQAQTLPTNKSGDIIIGNPAKDTDKDVGDIYIWREDAFPNQLFIELRIDEAENPLEQWFIKYLYVDIGRVADLYGIPMANGNPIPGKFSFKRSVEYETSYGLTIDLTDPALADIGITPTTSPIAVAVHANVCQGGVDAIQFALPDSFQVLTDTYVPEFTYISHVLITGGYPLSPEYINQSWCVDRRSGIGPEYGEFPATAYSSYDLPLPPGCEGKPLVMVEANLDNVNWLLNHYSVGQGVFDGLTSLGTIGMLDMQMAIWWLLEDEAGRATLPTSGYNKDIMDFLIAQATLAANDGYVPSCGEKLWIIISGCHPVYGQVQAIIVPIEVPCESCKTAWAAVMIGQAYQYPFPGKNWATYLKFYWPITPIL